MFETNIKLLGSFERAPSPLVGVLAGLGAAQRKTLHRVEYNGQLRGQIIFANVSRSRDGEQQTFMEQALGPVKVFMQFSPDGSELHVMENPHSAAPKFEILKRIASTEEVKIGS